MKHRLTFLLFAPLALAACDDTSPPPDAGQADAGAPVDAGPVLEPSELFGPCLEDWQCPGEGAICRTPADGYPSGYCTVPCEDRTPCDVYNVYHHCVARVGETQKYCEQRCLNGIDCGREAYTCAGEIPPSGGLCIPVCSSDDQCGAGTVCNVYSGECVEGEPAEGAVTGEPCNEDGDCQSGQCVPEVNENGVPTGWIRGYCSANCILPPGFNNNAFYSGEALPAGTCAGDAVCIPARGQSQGDLGSCYAECTSDDDCREGYGCLQEIGPLASGETAVFSNGLCVRKGCGPGAPCPSGYTCVNVPDANGQPNPVCAPQ